MIGFLLSYFFELTAFIFSIFYYKKTGGKAAKILMFFLGLTVLVETLGWYTSVVYWLELEILRGTGFERNFWLFNIYQVVSYLFYVYFFKLQLQSKKLSRILDFVLLFFGTTSLLYLVFSGVYFVSYSPFTLIVGTLAILLSISFFYYELLKNDEILSIRRSLPFYVSVGALVFHLCTTPIFLYSIFFD